MHSRFRATRWRFTGGLVLLSLTCGAAEARAVDANSAGITTQEANDDSLTSRRQRAEARYNQGVAAYREKRYKDAIDSFLEADSLAPSAALSYNAALAYERLLDSAGALRFYRDFLRRTDEPEEIARVKVRVQELERRLAGRGVQQVSVRSEPAGATIAIDGRAVGVTPWTTELPPGRHRISFSLKGHDEESREFDLPLEHAVDVDVTLHPGKAVASAADGSTAPSGASSPNAERQHRLQPWPWVALGVGGAALVSAGFFELSRRAAERDARGESTQVGYSERFDAMESRKSAARWLGVAGGALLVTSGVLFLLDARNREPAREATVSLERGRYFLSYRSSF
jgi:tetratricopeptide (TPR) repeat protein